jgi:hypothetical protein
MSRPQVRQISDIFEKTEKSGPSGDIYIAGTPRRRGCFPRV